MTKVKKFGKYLNEEFVGGETFYKIINKENIGTWLNKNFIRDKKTMVTSSREEVDQINPTKTAVELVNVPGSAVIDTEGNWSVVELYPVKDVVRVRPV